MSARAEAAAPGPGLRLHRLQGFYYVALAEGFTRAAASMPYPITESALHQQVRSLERELGTLLLVRGPRRRMVLTPEGRALHTFVRPFFEGLPALARALRRGEGGELVVACEPLYLERIAAALAEVSRAFPAARLRVVEEAAGEIAPLVAEGTADLGVTSAERTPDELAFEELGCLRPYLLAPATHPLARLRRPPSAERLRDHRYVLYAAGSRGRAFTEAALGAAEITVCVVAEATSARAMHALVAAGLAPALLPGLGRSRAKRRVRNADGTVAIDLGHLVPAGAQLPAFGLLRRRGAPTGGVAARFTEALRAALREAKVF